MARPPTKKIFAALIVASGRGQRAAAKGAPPKQYRILGAKSVLTRTLEVFEHHPHIDTLQVVIAAPDRPLYQAAARGLKKPLPPVNGGETRQQSVLAGLEALAALPVPPSFVLIHDGVRPLVGASTLTSVCEALAAGAPAVLPGAPITESLKRVDAAMNVIEAPERDGLFRAQTPQGFHFTALLAAHRKAAQAGRADFTDDAALAAEAGLPVRLVEGEANNIKLTYQADFAFAEALLAANANPQPHQETTAMPSSSPLETRIGQGFDVHAFEAGDHVMLGGVRIPFEKALKGHSDADVLLHAITDALFGALAEGDIGQHFPPDDRTPKGAASDTFLRAACELCRKRGGKIINVDATVICERPKVAPHCAAIRARIGEIMGLAPARVSVKATTSERLGFTGRGEGIAALACISVQMPGGAEAENG